ncbi:MAG TPA: inorganic phosphate transporter [Thermoanaerobaculia bacterium]
MEAGLILVLLLILGAEFVNGWTDSPNAIATVVGTRSLTPLQAVIMAAILNLLGVLSGTKVAATIGKGIVDASVIDLTTVAGAMVSIIIWSSLAAMWGIPTSESHALVAGLAGAGFATAGANALLWEGWRKVILGLFFSSVLGGLGGFILMVGVYWAFRKATPAKVKGKFRVLQIISSGLMAFAHGSNDGQKFMGVFTLTLVIAGALPAFQIPLWVIFLCAAVMAMGTLTGGWRIINTMGMKLTRLETHQGFAAEVAAASVIEAATRFGIPLSTTHTITCAIVGVGATRGGSAVNWGMTRRIVMAWVVTFPICGIISYLTVLLIRLVTG